MLQPGQNFPSEASSSQSDSDSYPSSTTAILPVATTVAVASTPTSSSKAASFPKAAIAGIVVGAVVLIGLGAGLCFFLGRAKSLKEEVDRQSFHPHPMSSTHTPGHLSPAAPPPSGIDSMYQSGGTVYIPVKAADLHRVSFQPYTSATATDLPLPAETSSSPGHTNAVVSQYEVLNHARHSTSPPPPGHERSKSEEPGHEQEPLEMYAPTKR